MSFGSEEYGQERDDRTPRQAGVYCSGTTVEAHMALSADVAHYAKLRGEAAQLCVRQILADAQQPVQAGELYRCALYGVCLAGQNPPAPIEA